MAKNNYRENYCEKFSIFKYIKPCCSDNTKYVRTQFLNCIKNEKLTKTGS